MKRTRTARAKIEELQEQIHSANKSKKEYSIYLKKLHEHYSGGKISYSKYIETLYQKRDGRNISEWIGYLDKYEKNCGEEIKKQKRKSAGKNFLVILTSLFLVSFFIFLSSNLNFPFSGFVVQENFSRSGIVSENTIQLPAILGQPVKWEKIIYFEEEGTAKISIPENAKKISVTKSYSENEEVPQINMSPFQEEPLQSGNSPITGAVISDNGIFKNFFGTLTGNAVSEAESKKVEFKVKDKNAEYKVGYETPSPKSSEKETETGKIIEISSKIKYENVLAFAKLQNEISKEKIKLYKTTDNTKEEIQFTASDENNNGLIEKIEWTIPKLNNIETYEIIIIIKAEHLDESRNFISDIYEQVKELDDIWSGEIPSSHFVRVTFEKNLTNKNDITIFPKIISGNPRIEIYEKDKTEKIAEFTEIKSNQINKIYLANLQGGQDSFDLKILRGSLQFDYIVDPQSILLPDATTNKAWNGTLNDNTLLITAVQPLGAGDYAKMTSLNGGTVLKPGTGSTSSDSFLYVNFTNIPAGYTAINVSVWLNNSLTTSSRTGIALWNWTKGNWDDVVNTSAQTAVTAKSYNIPATRFDDFVSGSELRVMAFDDSGSSSQFGIDYFQINVTYTPPADTTLPAVAILFPSTNNSNFSVNNVNVNYTASDAGGLFNFWYTNDTNLVNKSLGVAGTSFNITNITWSEGKHNVTIYANDTAGNVNQSRISFVVDTILPAISIAFPALNNTNNSNINLDVNFTASDLGSGLFNCWYTNDTNLKNTSLANCGTNITTITWSEGKHNVTIYANDTAGNVNQSRISFTIDTINPSLIILTPSVNNTNTTNINQNINFTFSDLVGIDSIWYNNDTTSVANKSLGSAGTYFNITNLTWSEGKHNVTIYANDSAGNLNFTGISFTIDLTAPEINITSPINNSVSSDVNQDINYTRSDLIDLTNCWYSNDTYLINTTLASCENITAVTWSAGAHNVTIWVNDSVGNYNRSTINFSISANNPPQIINVYNTTAGIIAVATGLNAGPSATYLEINFTAYDSNGDLDDTTASINVSMSGETIRENSSCFKYESSPTSANYTCSVTMWWWDGAGTWTINASISDLQSNFASNGSTNFSVGLTTGFEISPANLAWNSIIAGGTNQTSSNDPLILNNTGNKPIGGLGPTASAGTNISINATNLVGELNPSFKLYSGNFSVSHQTGGSSCTGASCLECSGDFMNKTTGNYANITSTNLTRGNFTADNRINGQEELYFCLKIAGNDLTSQSYSTLNQGVWTIKILAVAIIPAIKKKKKKTNSIKDDKLLDAFNLIMEEIKEKYSLNKKELLNLIIENIKEKYKFSRNELTEIIGAKEEIKIPITIFSKNLGFLESLSKYMKENLNMNYSEIAKLLRRDERTIWTSYKKSGEKQKEELNIKETDIFVPISKFKDKNFTILESLILFLKEKGMKYSEIAKLLERDQRNIWTIYSRIIKKK